MNQTVTFGLINRDEFLKGCADSYSLYLPLKGNGFHFCTMGKYIGLYCGTATGGKCLFWPTYMYSYCMCWEQENIFRDKNTVINIL